MKQQVQMCWTENELDVLQMSWGGGVWVEVSENQSLLACGKKFRFNF